MRLFALIPLLACWAAACASEPQLSPYQADVLQARFDKDMAFRDPDRSILEKGVRKTFTGLHYYDVDARYHFRLPLERFDHPDTIRATLRKGGADAYVRLGQVTFTLDGAPQRLTVFQPADGRRILWLPFTDATTGKSTYGGGRYLNPPLGRGDTLDVDFNRAYNPDCAYNPDRFNCALPPAENRLSVPVAAGEKKALLYRDL